MKNILKKKLFWILLVIFILIIITLVISNKKVDGSKGGTLQGPSHANGGIDAVIKGNNKKVSLEGNENILTKKVNEIQSIYNCYGTPAGIASSLNVIAGGVKFNDNGSCSIVN